MAVGDQGSREGSVLKWSDVLWAVPRTEVRVWLLARFRDRGFDAESFSRRATRVGMAEALTATEDWIEMHHPRWRIDRSLLKEITPHTVTSAPIQVNAVRRAGSRSMVLMAGLRQPVDDLRCPRS